ncbi:Crp/Fnr family transcriptional regulator [Maribacter algarum]|uniref:Crp/Fnr family transcriptional regulator n=1 Tax=Maribacter algarum (ex Zhang et al. 2020) TaxID=2578118 RepID=A0A5S3Q8U4_9FLAO|nr:Crp/Fnr family transcriptional regulator [Maribacter algarum]
MQLIKIPCNNHYKNQRLSKNLNEIAHQIAQNYCDLTGDILVDWSTKYTVSKYKRGTHLINLGQRQHKLFFVLEGSLKAYYLKDGKRIMDWFAFKNEFITSSTSYFTDEPSLHDIETMEDCILLETNKEDVEILCNTHHDFEHLFRIVLSKVIVQYRHRMFSLQFKTVKQRYQSLIKQYPKIELIVPLGDIASFLGITQETLSRIRASKE